MTDASHYQRIEAIFQAAIELPIEDRDAYLAEASAGDAEVLAFVARLLEHAESDIAFSEVRRVDPAASAATDDVGTIIGPYKLLELIGEGGFGAVYMAQQETPVRRKVALKVIKLGMDTNRVIARFEAERQALAMMDHPNIAKVFEAGATDNGRPYFVMELVRGIPITAFCDQNQLTTDERLDLFVRVCDAVQHAHQKGIIHRDLKPSNVLVTLHGETPVPTIIDFGIAKAIHQRLTEKTLFTEFNQFIGTPEYMSPEQAEMSGLDVDTRSDIYSLGVLLYELLTSTTPLDARSLRAAGLGEIQRLVREEIPPRPSIRLSTLGARLADVARHRRTEPALLARRLRRDLDWIVMKAIDKDRGRRYRTADEFAGDVGRYLASEPIVARPPSRRYIARKFAARHRVLATSASAIALALVGTAVATTWSLVETRRAVERAETINEFMEGVLVSSDPLRGRSDVRFLDVLESAAGEVEGRFADHPLVEARVHELLGSAFTNLGRHEGAEPEFRAAYEIYAAELPPDDDRNIVPATRLAHTLLELQRLNEAETLARAVLAKRSLTARQRLDAAIVLASAPLRRGDTTEAVRRLRVQVDDTTRVLGEDDDLTFTSMLNLGAALSDHASRLGGEAAEAAFAEAREMMTGLAKRAAREYGPDDYRTVSVTRRLFRLAEARGDHAEAARLAELALERARPRLGEDHPFALDAMMTIGQSRHRQGRSEEGAEWVIRAIDGWRRVRGDHSLNTIVNMTEALSVLRESGHDEQGEAYARILYGRFCELMGPDHDMTLGYRVSVAHFLTRQGRHDEAGTILAELLAQEESLTSLERRTDLHLTHAEHLAALERYDEAERALTRVLALHGGDLAKIADDDDRARIARAFGGLDAARQQIRSR